MNNITGFSGERVKNWLISIAVGFVVALITTPMFASSGVSGIGAFLGLICAIAVYKRLSKKKVQ
jgi:hypothetical protein